MPGEKRTSPTVASGSAARARLLERMARLKVAETDLKETFARSSGPGGQNVNKVSTAVTLVHLPSGLSVCVQDSRSQAMNRQLARARLLDLIEERRLAEKQARLTAQSRKRRQNPRRSRASKERMLEVKRRRAEVKKLRRNVE